MNMVLTFLHNNWHQLDLGRHGVPRQLTCTIMTPRFRASSHVIFLLLARGQSQPVLVAKVPRLGGASASLAREAANLRAIQAGRPGGFDSIPRLIAFEDDDWPILVETALTGRLLDPATIDRNRDDCCQVITDWLIEIQQPGRIAADSDPDWFERLIDRPLRDFETVFPLTLAEAQLLDQTRELVGSLRQANVPLVFEHGDLSHPNIFWRKNGSVGVVDWELAEPRGLPACDLFFFLTYAAFARSRAQESGSFLPAFHSAFFGPAAWTRPYVAKYAGQMGLSSLILTSLFVLGWARYMANLLLRLDGGKAAAEPKPVAPETADWLRGNRYYALWKHILMHLDELNWHDIL